MINLLPPKALLNMRIARNNTVLRRYIELVLVALAVLLVVIAGAYYYLYRQQTDTQRSLTLLQENIGQLEPVQKDAEQLSASINTIANLISQDIRFSHMLSQIGGLMPPGTILTGLQFSVEDTEAPLVISARVETEEKAATLRNNLAQSNLFETADIKSIAKNDSTAPIASVPEGQTQESTYPYTAVIDAYFKPASERMEQSL